MKSGVKLGLKIVGGLLAFVVVLMVGLVGLFHTDYFQEKAFKQVETLLREQLQTHVSIGSVQVSLFGQDINIRDVCVEDLQHRKMLQLERVGVSVALLHLLQHELYITEAKVSGLDVRLYKARPDTAANYQFVLDAFKKNPTSTQASDSVAKPKPKQKLRFDVGKLSLSRIKVTYNDTLQAELGHLMYSTSWRGRKVGEIRELRTAFVQRTKKGPVDAKVRVGVVEFREQKDHTLLSIDSLCYFTDNHLPRKNVGKPKRGFFDAGHLDVVAKLNLRIDEVGKDSVTGAITHLHCIDRGSGLHVTDFNCRFGANKQSARLSGVTVKMPNTTVAFDEGVIQFPSKKEGRPMAYRTSVIKGTTQLKDISKPFARVLYKFTQPLQFQTLLTGGPDEMRFDNVVVNTPDKKLTVSAKGFITGLKDKYKLHVHFDVNKLTTTGHTAEHLINQFSVKKFMMKQLNALGTLTFKGHFDVLYKREQFAGQLMTAHGGINLHFDLDEQNKYVIGSAQTKGLELGKIMDMPDLGRTAAKANFKFDISKPRTAQMRKLKGGKLPIGHVDAQVDEARFKGVKVTNVQAIIDSDGAIAEGFIKAPGKFATMSCSFSFTNTNEMKKTKIKPGIRFHLFDKASPAEKAEKEKRKAEEAAAKEKRKAEKAAAKEKRKAEEAAAKEKRKAEEAAAKEKRKAEKAAAKEKRKAEKAARKAEKEAAKAAQKAAKEAAKS